MEKYVFQVEVMLYSIWHSEREFMEQLDTQEKHLLAIKRLAKCDD